MTDEQTLLRTCVQRALELSTEPGQAPGPWTIMTSANRGAKCAGFIVLWAQLLHERGLDEISVEDYGRAGFDSLRTSYRRLADFRLLFPDESDPNRIARMVAEVARERSETPSPDLALAI